MKTKISISLFALTLLFFFATPLKAQDVSAESKLEALKAEHHSTNQVGQNTLAAPLMSATAGASVTVTTGPIPSAMETRRGVVEALFTDSTEIGSKGNLSYDQVAGQGVHVRLTREADQASLFFSFDSSKDLRNRWVRVRYSGMAVPESLTLRFDHDEARREDFKIYPENSLESKFIFFKLPDKTSYADIHSMRFVMDPQDQQLLDADFMIEGLDVFAAGEEPLAVGK